VTAALKCPLGVHPFRWGGINFGVLADIGRKPILAWGRRLLRIGTRSLGTSCAFGFTCGTGAFLKDIQTHLEKLRGEAAECLVLSNLATDPEKRQVFARLAEHITGLASAVQNEVAVEPANVVRATETAVVSRRLDPAKCFRGSWLSSY
jgi:hypothetical protein